jgi:hypothetical protein
VAISNSTVVQLQGGPPKRGKTQYNPVISKKDPERNTERDQIPPGVHLAADEESAQGRRYATTGEEPLGVAQRVETTTAVKRRSGCPTPIQSGRGERKHAAPCRRRRAPAEARPPRTNQAAPESDSTTEPRGSRGGGRRPHNKYQPVKQKALRCKDLPPRHLGRPGRNISISAATPPLSLASMAVQEWWSG